MSASEKLKAFEAVNVLNWPVPTAERTRIILDALPQIVAVVEAAERMLPEDEPWDIDQDCRFCRGHYGKHFPECEWKQGHAALAALDEALP